MIIKGLFNLIYSFLSVILTPFEIIPDVPHVVQLSVSNYMTFITAPVRILLFFTDVNVVKALIPVVLVVINMEHIWDGIMWVLKKLPFVGIE